MTEKIKQEHEPLYRSSSETSELEYHEPAFLERLKVYRGSKSLFMLTVIIMVVFATSTAILSIHLSSMRKHLISPITGLDQRRVPIFEGYRNRIYQPGMPEADAAWANIEQGHGLIALNKTWALSKGLTLGVTSPMDRTEALFFIASYHAMHCIAAVRMYLKKASNGHQLALHEQTHALHCLDALREEVMCNADDTPVPAYRNHSDLIGAGQARMCRKWEDVRDWATKYTTCYASSTQIEPGQGRFDRCDDGDDGLVIAQYH